MKKKLALFDFDGTVTTEDTLLTMIRFMHGNVKFIGGMLYLSPSLIAMKAGLLKNSVAKEKALRLFFGGTLLTDFEKLCERFTSEKIPLLIRPKAAQAIQQHLEQGDDVFIVSASPENWVQKWCVKTGVGCIATKLKTENGIITGKIDGENCYGEEKVKRIRQTVDISVYAEIFAYGDTKGDIPMLSISTSPFYKPFR